MGADRAADSSGELTFAVDRLIGHDLDGRYRIEALLGRGGMGAVLRARHLFTEQVVAIKVLRPTLARDPAAARRFVREARGTFQVDSEHAIKVLDFGASTDGLLYMVLELLDGETVGAELAREGRLPARRAVHIARQVAIALQASHRIGLIHRDLKPDNVMLIRRGGDPDFVKVLDFGLVKVIEGAGEKALSMAALTQGDLVFGTPDYMAPEQALGRPLDQRTDLYALGAMMFELMTGRPLFEAANAMEILVAHVRETPATIAEVVGGAVDAEVEALVARLLAKDPAGRPGSADAVAAELAAIEARLGGAAARGAHAQTVELAPVVIEPVPVPDLVPVPVPVPELGAGLAAENEWRMPSYGGGTAALARVRDRRGIAIVAVVLGLAAIIAVIAVGSSRDGTSASAVTDAGLAVAIADAQAIDAALAHDVVIAIDAGIRPTAPRAPETSELDRHLAAAEQARRAGNSLKQLAEANLALDLDPRSARARYLMGDALVTTGDVSNGCRFLRGARRLPAAARRLAAAGCSPAD